MFGGLVKIIWSFLTGLSLRTWLIAGAVALWGWWSVHQYNEGWRAKELEVQIATLKKNAEVNRKADEEEARHVKELTAENEQQEKKLNEYLEKLKTRPQCPLGDDADELNSL